MTPPSARRPARLISQSRVLLEEEGFYRIVPLPLVKRCHSVYTFTWGAGPCLHHLPCSSQRPGSWRGLAEGTQGSVQ